MIKVRGSMSPKIRLCKEEDCNNQQTTSGYCRLHYLKNWREIKAKKKERSVKELNRYIDNIMRKNPDKGVAALKQNLKEEGQFEQSVGEYLYEDDLNSVLEGLGYKSDADLLLEDVKIDETF